MGERAITVVESERIVGPGRIRDWFRDRHPTHLGWAVALATLLGLTLFLMRNWLRGGLPASSRCEGLTELSLVWMFKQELLQGRLLSEWSPYWFAGLPWLRFLSYPLYYIVAAFSAWGGLSLETCMVLFYFVVLAGSGLTMFAYLRRLLGDWRPALVGAIIYEAFPYHNHVGVETWIHAAFWALLPLPFWFIERSRGQGRSRLNNLLLTGLTLGCFPIVSSEYAILAAPFVVFYLTVREWNDVHRGGRRWLPALGGYALVGLVALGVSTFFVLPALMEVGNVGIHAKHGMGTTFTNELIRDYSVTPALVWYAIARRLHLPASIEGLPGLVQSFWSVSWYPGLIVPLLGLLGLLAVRRHFAARVALVGLGLSLLLITGPTFPLNFFTRLPVFGRLSPFRGMLLVVAFAAILAAYGMQRLLRRFRGHWLGLGLVVAVSALVIVDFGPSASAYSTLDHYFGASEREAYAWLEENAKGGRLLESVVSPRDQYIRTYALSELPMLRFAGYYDNGAPLHTWEQNAWTDLATTLRLQQVRYAYLVAGDPIVDDLRKKLVESGYHRVFLAEDVEVWENPTFGGYAQIYGQAALDTTTDFHHSFKALPGFVWRDIAMVSADSLDLDRAPTDLLSSFDYYLVESTDADQGDRLLEEIPLGRQVLADGVMDLPTAGRVEATIWLKRDLFGDIRLDVRAPLGGVLSIAESWYPHWRATVDGHPAQVLRVNWSLLGVRLEPGMHKVIFHFRRPVYVYIGYTISLITMAALVAWWIYGLIAFLNRLHAPVTEMRAEVAGEPDSASRAE